MLLGTTRRKGGRGIAAVCAYLYDHQLVRTCGIYRDPEKYQRIEVVDLHEACEG